MKQNKGRVEDALHATRAAVAEGIVPGGGTALLRVHRRRSTKLGEEARRATRRAGAEIVARALAKPVRTIAENCGKDGAVVADEVATRGEKNPNIGYRCQYRRLRRYVQGRHRRPDQGHALAPCRTPPASPGLMLTTEVMVTKIDEDDKKSKVTGSIA